MTAWLIAAGMAVTAGAMVAVVLIQRRAVRGARRERDGARRVTDEVRKAAERDRRVWRSERAKLRLRVQRLERWQEWILRHHPGAIDHLDWYVDELHPGLLRLAERLDDNARGES